MDWDLGVNLQLGEHKSQEMCKCNLNMNIGKLFRMVSVVILMGAPRVHSQGSLTLYIQNDNGNSQLTLVATNLQFAVGPMTWEGFGIPHADSLWNGPLSDLTEYLTDFATVRDVNLNENTSIGSFLFHHDSVNGDVFSLYFGAFPAFGSSINVNPGDTIQITPYSTTQTVPIPFSYFSPGTLSTPAGSLFNVPFTVIVEPVPEPSALALLSVGFACLTAGGRIGRRWPTKTTGLLNPDR